MQDYHLVNDLNFIGDMAMNVSFCYRTAHVTCIELGMTIRAIKILAFAQLTFLLVPKACLSHFNLKVSTTTSLKFVVSTL